MTYTPKDLTGWRNNRLTQVGGNSFERNIALQCYVYLCSKGIVSSGRKSMDANDKTQKA